MFKSAGPGTSPAAEAGKLGLGEALLSEAPRRGGPAWARPGMASQRTRAGGRANLRGRLVHAPAFGPVSQAVADSEIGFARRGSAGVGAGGV